jgi:hypothetical protein
LSPLVLGSRIGADQSLPLGVLEDSREDVDLLVDRAIREGPATETPRARRRLDGLVDRSATPLGGDNLIALAQLASMCLPIRAAMICDGRSSPRKSRRCPSAHS